LSNTDWIIEVGLTVDLLARVMLLLCAKLVYAKTINKRGIRGFIFIGTII
jgi:hypothetical protein